MVVRNTLGQFTHDENRESFEGFGIWADSKGYPCIFVDSKEIRIHVYVWERINGKKPPRHDIHHNDFNKKNYSYDNLQLLSCSDHQKVHAGWVKIDGEWAMKPCTKCRDVLPLSEFYERKGYTPTACCKKCHCLQTAEWGNKNINKRRTISLNYWRRKHGKEVMPYANE